MLLKFDYKDAKGKESKRIVYSEASNAESLFCTDLGELSEEELQEYITLRDNAKQQYEKMIFEINEAFDLKHRYRNFLLKNITNLIKE